MPEGISKEWLGRCLSRVDGFNVFAAYSESDLIFFCDSQVLGSLDYDRDAQVLSFVTGINVKYNEHLYEIVNYRNLVCNLQMLSFDKEKEIFSLVMNLDVSAGVTAGQVEHAFLIFIREMRDFYADFIQ